MSPVTPEAASRARVLEPGRGDLTDHRPGVSGLSRPELESWLAQRSHAPYRARQIEDDLWRHHVASVDEMRTLPAALRVELAEAFSAQAVGETLLRRADAGLTEKALHQLVDGRSVESVLMRYPARGGRRERNTVCISSQAGCAVGCPFCATGELGFWRDLDVAEIVDQVRFWARHLAADGGRVSNVVFMGMGEPLLNADAVIAAAEALADPQRGGLAARHITISTSGVLPGMERLVALRPQWTLAVSLHAARPALRDILVPLNRRYPADAVVAAASQYAALTGRRVSYEYVMIEGINDTHDDARALAALLRGRLAHVNLIPMNPVAHTAWRPSSPARIEGFAAVVRDAHIPVSVRRNRGVEIGAACGQLAAELDGIAPPVSVERRREALVRRSSASLTPASTAPATRPGR